MCIFIWWLLVSSLGTIPPQFDSLERVLGILDSLHQGIEMPPPVHRPKSCHHAKSI